MMKSRNRIINMIVFSQILVLFAVLIWLWIRRFSKEGIVKTPRMEIDLFPQKPPPKPAAEIPARSPAPLTVEPSVEKPAEKPVKQDAEQSAPVQAPHAPKPVPTRRQAVKPDDLKRIEGIGPKISAALQAAGISTYKQVARARVERLKGIVSDAGIIADPTTWPEQAALAAAGDWLGLAELKSKLKGGRRMD
jgi:predicted flap endonuclease-1-like 5' DNA nuclease